MLPTWVDRHFRVYVDYRDRIVIVVRSALAFGSELELMAALSQVEKALATLDPTRNALLIDSRAAPAISAALEPPLSAWSARVFDPFRPCAVLVATTSGATQAKRLKSRTVGTVLITSSAAEAGKHVGFKNLAAVIDDLQRVR